MTLEIISCGFDFGNGWPKISINEVVGKIPNWSVTQEPKGALNAKSGLASTPMAFPLELNKVVLWFGQDTLSMQGYQEIDSDKYKPDYIRTMFKATLYRWLTQPGKGRVDTDWLGDKRLNVVCGMPPEQYQSRSARNQAEKAYKHVFNNNKPDYIKVPNKPAIPFFTSFGGLRPETLVWKETNGLKPGLTLLVDLGYGTSDFTMLHSNKDMPEITKSLPNGLLHSHNVTNPVSPWLAELDTMRKVNRAGIYGNITKAKIRTLARQVELVQLVVFGGGIRLFSKADLADLRGYATQYTQGDEFTNVRLFERVAKSG